MSNKRIEEKAHLARDKPSGGQHRPYSLIGKRRVGQPDFDQAAFRQIRPHIPLGQLNDAEALQTGFMQSLQTIGGKSARNRLPDSASAARQRPLPDAGHAQTVMICKVGSAPWRAAACQIMRCGVEASAIVGQAPGDEAAVLELAKADRDVDTLCNNIDDGVAQQQFDLQLTMGGEEVGEHRRQHLAPERHRRGDPQQARRGDGAPGNGGAAVLGMSEHCLCMWQERFSLDSERERTGRAMHQSNPKLRFERSQPA